MRVAAPFGGRLRTLAVARGDTVSPGTLLFALDPEPEAGAVREAAARVARAAAARDDLARGARPAELAALKARVGQADAQALFADRELARISSLAGRGHLPPQQLDEARTGAERARLQVADARAQLELAAAGPRPDALRTLEAELDAARQVLAQAAWRAGEKSVAAGVAATVVEVIYRPGEWVPAGAPVVELLPPGAITVRFFVPEGELAAVRVGQPVALAIDGRPGPLAATVSFVSPRAEYTPPVIYGRETRGRLVFQVEARPTPGLADSLHPGQPLEVSLP